MIFKKWVKKPLPRIEVFVRHCNYSNASVHKERFLGFCREKCFHNLIETADLNRVNMTFFFDSFYPSEKPHFIKKQTQFPVIEVKAGNEAHSFLSMLDYVCQQSLSPDTIIYFLEDDYLHKQGWVDILMEGVAMPGADYVTLFDHKDKYFLQSYATLQSKIMCSTSCHWRTTPSTTNTYAMSLKTLKTHLDVHKAFSLGRQITADHDKFCRLHELGATLISSIPGFSTHAEPPYASPCVDWASMFTL